MSVLKRTIRGVRQKLPAGYLLGRKSAGDGPVEAISFSDVARQLATTPGGAASQTAAMTYGLAANRPTAPSVPVGQLAFYYATDTAALSVWNGSTWANVGGGSPALFDGIMSLNPTKANTGFGTTFVDQAGMTLTETVNGLFLSQTGNGSVNKINMTTKAAPAAPYTATLLLLNSRLTAGFPGFQFGWYDGTNKAEVIGVVNQSATDTRISRYTWTTPTTLNTTDSVTDFAFVPYVWLRLKDDGTNITLQAAINPDDYLTLISHTRAAGFLGSTGYTNLCIGVDAFNAVSNFTVTSYKETSP